jgi:hypothetical protein
MAETTKLGLIDWETGDTTQCTAVTASSGNTVTAATASKLHGTYGGRIYLAGTTNVCYYYKTLAENQAKLYIRKYLNINTIINPATTSYLVPLDIRYDASVQLSYIRMSVNTDGVVTLDRLVYKTSGGSGYEALSSVLTVGQTYRLELLWDYNAGSNTVQTWLDGTSLASKTAISQSTWQYATRGYGGINNYSGGVLGSGSIIFDDDFNMDSSAIGAYADEEVGSTIAGSILNSKTLKSVTLGRII